MTPTPPAWPSTPEPPPLAFDEREWDRLWERQLDQVDRHRYGSAVWRGRLPDDPLGRRVVPELARRWRRRALVYGAAWAVFAGFWALVGIGTLQAGAASGSAAVLPWAMVTLGFTVAAGCLVARDRFGRTSRPH